MPLKTTTLPLRLASGLVASFVVAACCLALAAAYAEGDKGKWLDCDQADSASRMFVPGNAMPGTNIRCEAMVCRPGYEHDALYAEAGIIEKSQ